MTQTYKVQVSMNQAHIVESGFVWKQGDFGFNIEIEVLDFDTSGATPQIIFRKSTGAVEATHITRDGNKFTYAIRGTELDTPGPCICDLKLNDSTTKRVSTASFKYFVIPDTMDGLNQQASSYSDTIEQLLENTLQKSATSGLVKNDGSINTNIENNVTGNTTQINALKDALSVNYIKVPAGEYHSSGSDVIPVQLSSGDTIKLYFTQTGNAAVAIYLKNGSTNVDTLTTDKIYNYTASSTIDGIGIYADNHTQNTPTTIYSYITKDEGLTDNILRSNLFNESTERVKALSFNYQNDDAKCYFEESGNSLYFHPPAMIIINNKTNTNKYYEANREFAADFSGNLVTSPKGEQNCIIIEHHRALIYNYAENKMYIRNTLGLQLGYDELVLIRNTIGAYINTGFLFDQYVLNRFNNLENTTLSLKKNTFVITAGTTHSSSNDKLDFNIKSGVPIYVYVAKSANVPDANGDIFMFNGSTSKDTHVQGNTISKIIPDANYDSIGFYYNATSIQSNFNASIYVSDQESYIGQIIKNTFENANNLTLIGKGRKYSFNYQNESASSYFEENGADLYYHPPATIIINNQTSTNKYYNATGNFDADFAEQLVTSPEGESNCLLIAHHRALVYNFEENKMYIRSTLGLQLAFDEVVLIRNTIGVGINDCVLADEYLRLKTLTSDVSKNVSIVFEEELQKMQQSMFCVAMQSDTHYYQLPSQKEILKLPGHFAKDVGYDCFVNLGDVIRGYADRTLAQERQDLSNAVKQYIDTCEVPVMICKGNHDDATLLEYESGSKSINNVIQPAEQYARFVKPIERYGIVRDPSNQDSLYYYKDFPNNRTRVIILNCIDVPYENDGNGHMIATGQWDYGYTNNQINWFADTLEEMPAGWTAVICTHISVDSSLWTGDLPVYNSDVMFEIIKAFKNGDSYSNTFTNTGNFHNTGVSIGTWFDGAVSVDFNGNEHNVVCFSGHTHTENTAYTDNIRCIVLPGFMSTEAVDFYCVDTVNKKVYLEAYGRTPSTTEFSI